MNVNTCLYNVHREGGPTNNVFLGVKRGTETTTASSALHAANGWNLCKQIFWTSEHPCCKESRQNGMKSRHSQETVIKCALEGRKVAPANMCRCVYMDAGELCGNPIYHHTESEHLQCLLYISLCTFQILWNPTWLVQKHKETYKHYGSCVWYTHTHTAAAIKSLLLNYNWHTVLYFFRYTT